MEKEKVDQMVMMYASKIPAESIGVVRERLLQVDDTRATFAFANLKDPTVALIISFFFGYLGVDRLYIGDYVLGIIKFLTLGFCGLWSLIDLFLIMDATKKKNLETVLTMI